MIILNVGAMKSGKTENLIKLAEDVLKQGQNIRIFYPACCEKENEYIVSRNGKRLKAIKIFDTTSLFNHVLNVNSIFIDEVQFIDNLTEDNFKTFFLFLDYCVRKNINVYCYGLDLDFKGESFKIVNEIFAYADHVIKLTSSCELCNSFNGRRTIRYNNNIPSSLKGEVLCLEGDNIEYKTVCIKCFNDIYVR